MGFKSMKSEDQTRQKSMEQRKKNPRFEVDNHDMSCQRLMWGDLERKIDTLMNNLNSSNIRDIVQEFLSLNLIKGRGLFCRAILESVEAFQTSHVPVFAALVAAINVKFPDVGYLLLKRIIFQVKIRLKMEDKVQILKSVKLIAHLVNQGVVDGALALGLLMFLLQDPYNEASVETSVYFLAECGYALQDLIPRGLLDIFECLRTILEDGHISKESKSQINELFRNDRFEGCPDIPTQLDIVNLEDQVSHEISFHCVDDPEFSLDEFNPDP